MTPHLSCSYDEPSQKILLTVAPTAWKKTNKKIRTTSKVDWIVYGTIQKAGQKKALGWGSSSGTTGSKIQSVPEHLESSTWRPT